MGGDSGTGVGCGAFPFYDGGLLNGSTLLSQNRALWSPDPPPYTAIVQGSYSDSANPYNQHTGLPSNELDFWPGILIESDPGVGVYIVTPVPEPIYMVMLATGLLGLAGWKKKNFPRK